MPRRDACLGDRRSGLRGRDMHGIYRWALHWADNTTPHGFIVSILRRRPEFIARRAASTPPIHLAAPGIAAVDVIVAHGADAGEIGEAKSATFMSAAACND